MGFERCHPAVNFIYFSAVMTGTLLFQHPVFLAISFLCAFAYSVKRSGGRSAVFNIALLPLVAAFALYYSSYHHFGVTVLRQNLIGNNMTLAILIPLAALIGIIPESGPHLIFVLLYAHNPATLPALLASCISQDGHASIPLLAESRESFLWAKIINCFVALVAGFGAMLFM